MYDTVGKQRTGMKMYRPVIRVKKGRIESKLVLESHGQFFPDYSLHVVNGVG